MNKNKIIATVAVLMIGGALAWYVFLSGSFEPNSASSGNDNGPVAIVNGQEISRTDFNDLSEQNASQQGFDLSSLDAEMRKQFETEIVNALISQTLLEQAANNSGVTAASADVDTQMDIIKSQFETEEEFEIALLAEGITVEELRTLISQDLAIQAYLQKELNLSVISATEEEIEEVYGQAAAVQEVPPFEEVRDQVKILVIQQKQQELRDEFVAKLRTQAEIKIFI
jgi:hypothetical protein